MLYLVATPIGNLEDFTFRAVRILSNCSYLLCEDTRKSGILLKRYEIKVPLISFHKFNEKKREEKIIADLKAGLEIALISDAGTPTISDPGFELAKRCRRENIKFTAIPGPCSIIQALLLANRGEENFQFLGFFPKKKKAATEVLQKAFSFQGASLFFESPHRILKTVRLIAQMEPSKEIAIAREMTKIHEECLKGKSLDLQQILEKKPLKGEIVLII